jgi:hypothetical protein
MSIVRRLCYLQLGVVVLALNVQLVAGASRTLGPLDIVKRYCELDYDGARLKSESFPAMDKLQSWKVEPGWDQTIIVKSFTIKSHTIHGTSAVVSVEYALAGLLDGEEFQSKPEIQSIDFKLKRIGDSWRITGPVITPHVSPAAMQKHIDGLVKLEGQESMETWSKVLSQLKSLGPAPQ